MKTRDAIHVQALQKYLDAHDAFLQQSQAVYNEYLADGVEDLDFQRDLVTAALGAKRLWAAELATGIGKSIIAARIALARAAAGPTLYICASPTAIGDLQQGIINKFHRVFSTFGGKPPMLGTLNQLSRLNDVSFLTPGRLASLAQRNPQQLQDVLQTASCVFVDEAHHFPSEAVDALKVYGRVYDLIDTHVRDGLVVAMTGTYDRLDGRTIMGKKEPDVRLTVQDAVDLGRCPEIYAIQIIMDVMAKGASAVGDLYDIHLEGTERDAYYRSIAECIWTVYKRYPVPAAAFARTQADAAAIADAFNTLSGLSTERGLAVLTSRTPQVARRKVVQQILAGTRAGYITCAVGEEALDVPPLEVIHLIRRTRSITRNSQAAGRAFRLHKGKRRALLIDYQMMLDGVVKKFIGLPVTQLRDASQSRTQRAVNGGPIVCQKSYPDAALVGMTMDEERALILRQLNPGLAYQEELQQKLAAKRAEELADRPRQLAEWHRMYDAWTATLQHYGRDGGDRLRDHCLDYFRVTATYPETDFSTHMQWLTFRESSEAVIAMRSPANRRGRLRRCDYPAHYTEYDLKSALHLNRHEPDGCVQTLQALWVGRNNPETIAAVVILAFIAQLRSERRSKQACEIDSKTLELLTQRDRTDARRYGRSASIDVLLLDDAKLINEAIRSYETELFVEAEDYTGTYFQQFDEETWEQRQAKPDGERVWMPNWHHASTELLPLALDWRTARMWRPRELADIAVMAAMHWLTVRERYRIVRLEFEDGEAGPKPEYYDDNFKPVAFEPTVPLELPFKIAYAHEYDDAQAEILRRAKVPDAVPPPFVDAPGLSQLYEHVLTHARMYNDDEFLRAVKEAAPHWFEPPPQPKPPKPLKPLKPPKPSTMKAPAAETQKAHAELAPFREALARIRASSPKKLKPTIARTKPQATTQPFLRIVRDEPMAKDGESK